MSFFRNLFGRRSGASDSTETATVTPPPAASIAAPVGASVQQPGVPTSAPVPANGVASAPAVDCISFPLKAITDIFPLQLMGALRKSPSEHVLVNIPRSLVAPQLASGAVRITFGQLRAASPEIFFRADVAPDDTPVQLPLDIVLRLMMPTRRPDQQRPAIPVNIPSVFSTKSPAPDRPGSPAGGTDQWYSQRRPVYTAPPDAELNGAAEPSQNGHQPDFANGHDPVIAKPEQPAPEPAPEPVASVGSSFLPNPEPFAPAPTPEAHHAPIPTAQAVPEEPPMAAAPVASVPAVPPPPVVQVPPGSFAIPITSVIGVLPEQVIAILSSAAVMPAAFIIPLEQIETRMRTGRLRFLWTQLQEWCDAPYSASVPPDLEIDLPLATVVPLFMAARKVSEPRKKVEVDARIPDVFGKTNVPVQAEPETPEPAPVAETPAPAPAPAPEPPAPEPAAGAEPPAPVPSPILPMPAASILPMPPQEAAPAATSFLATPPPDPAAPPSAPQATPTSAPAVPSLRLERPDAPSQPISAPPPEIHVTPPEPLAYKLEKLEGAPSPASEPVPQPVPFSTPAPAPDQPTSDASSSPATAPSTIIPEPIPTPVSAPSFIPEPAAPVPIPIPIPVAAAVPVPVAVAAPVAIPAPVVAPAPAPVAIPLPRAAAPAPSPVPTPVVVTASAPAIHSHQDPPTTTSAPAILVRNIRALDGVHGVFMATADGLLIASDMPNANENLLAAFAPTVFSQMSKYSGMARLGPPESIDLNLGTACIHVRKAGNVYLGVLLPPGTTLPRTALPLISSFLKPHTP